MPELREPSDQEKKEPLLSLISHEFSNPLAVIIGYLKMVLKDAGALSEPHRKMLLETQNSAAKLAGFAVQLRDLSRLAAGGVKFARSSVDLAALLESEAASPPPLPDGREIGVTFRNEAPGARVSGDPERLKAAFSGVVFAVRRQLVTTNELSLSLRRQQQNGRPLLRVTIAGNDRIETVESVPDAELTGFNEFEGGMGFAVPMARRILEAHDARLLAPAGLDAIYRKAAAVVLLPEN